jgi:hypothetical protein
VALLGSQLDGTGLHANKIIMDVAL